TRRAVNSGDNWATTIMLSRFVDRWRELEGATAKIPQTFSEALRLAADLEDQKAELEKQLALAAPKVDFADRVGEASGILFGPIPTTFAKFPIK
ncbi:hypothetical protein ACUOA8_54410, partial [Escherichia sp. SS-MK2]